MKQPDEKPWELPFPCPGTLQLESPERTRTVRAVFGVAQRIHNGNAELPEPDFDLLIKAIERPGYFDWRTRRSAAWTLGHASLDSVRSRRAADALVSALSEDHGLRQIPRRWGHCLLLCLPIPLLILLAERWWEYAGEWSLSSAALVAWFMTSGMLLIPYVPIALAIDHNRGDLVTAECLRSLARLRIPETVPKVIDKLAHVGRRSHEAADNELPDLLECITAEHYGRIARLTSCLCDQFFWSGIALQRAIVSALSRAGDGWAADRLAQYRNTQPVEVQRWIDEALVVLKERKKKEQHAERLLRPSGAPESGELLRPAMGSEPQHEALLRPSVPE